MKTIGLIGGMSPESTAHYYQAINRHVNARLGGHHSARQLIASIDFGELVPLQEQDRWDDAAALLIDAAKRLERAGAEVIAITANTMHLTYDRVAAAVKVPMLHIGEPLGVALSSASIRSAALLGTRYTMEKPFLREFLSARFGIETRVPDTGEQRDLQRIIFDELVHGRVLAASTARQVAIIDAAKQRGAQAVILGCTELAMAIDERNSPLPVFDTTDLHARTLAAFALA